MFFSENAESRHDAWGTGGGGGGGGRGGGRGDRGGRVSDQGRQNHVNIRYSIPSNCHHTIYS